ncbi:hypothetical protein [Paucisalibacillus sp. EB02]|uniref:hypothetical protein n=1 Tax=Paucisalibacillus sp. EB02 TaxID=1347087 RepID=UPI0004B6DCE1|nr:hypothetical protein [Paucisalibacillus sp. EB02]
MKLKKLLLTIFILILSTGLLAACTEDPEEPASDEDSTEQQETGDVQEDQEEDQE